jgi:hypothetical protein
VSSQANKEREFRTDKEMAKARAGYLSEAMMPDHEAENGVTGGSARAVRYDICTRIRFRVSGEKDWREGRTKNISASGVLFGADYFVEPLTGVEMKFAFSGLLGGAKSAEAFCRGTVVRVSMCANEPGTVLLASTIAFARISRQRTQEQTPESRKRSGSRRFPGR